MGCSLSCAGLPLCGSVTHTDAKIWLLSFKRSFVVVCRTHPAACVLQGAAPTRWGAPKLSWAVVRHNWRGKAEQQEAVQWGVGAHSLAQLLVPGDL